MASNAHTDDLLPEQTEGYKVGEKKTMDEYHKMGKWAVRWSYAFAQLSGNI